MSSGDVVTLEDGTVLEYGSRTRPLFHLAAPVVAAAAIWSARQGIGWVYERVTGRTPPSPRDPQTSWSSALMWTAATATSAALIEVVVHRLGDERTLRVIRRARSSASSPRV